MWRTWWRIGLTVAVLGGAGAGCQRQSVRTKPPPPDPLLISKKPVEGRPGAGPEATARVEPPLPPGPEGDQWATSPLREAAPASRSVRAP
jgi:hypothetical protein